jgi:hypothetical protein
MTIPAPGSPEVVLDNQVPHVPQGAARQQVGQHLKFAT